MTAERPAEDREYIRRAFELCVHIGLAILLVGACLLILRPFLPLVVWGAIIAISIYPGFKKLQTALGGHGGLAAVLCTTLLLAALVVPVVLLTKTVVEGVHNLVTHVQDGTLAVPPPPPSVENWFVIGPPLMSLWSKAATNLSAALVTFAPGFDPEPAMEGRGIGLASMKERLKLVNGSFSIDSQPNRGTTIQARVPFAVEMKFVRAAG